MTKGLGFHLHIQKPRFIHTLTALFFLAEHLPNSLCFEKKKKVNSANHRPFTNNNSSSSSSSNCNTTTKGYLYTTTTTTTPPPHYQCLLRKDGLKNQLYRLTPTRARLITHSLPRSDAKMSKALMLTMTMPWKLNKYVWNKKKKAMILNQGPFRSFLGFCFFFYMVSNAISVV